MQIRLNPNTGTAHLFYDEEASSFCGRASRDDTAEVTNQRMNFRDLDKPCGRCLKVDAASTGVEETESRNGDFPLSDVPILELDEVTLTIVTWRGHGAGLVEDLLPTIAQAEGYQILATIDTNITEREGRVTLEGA